MSVFTDTVRSSATAAFLLYFQPIRKIRDRITIRSRFIPQQSSKYHVSHLPCRPLREEAAMLESKLVADFHKLDRTIEELVRLTDQYPAIVDLDELLFRLESNCMELKLRESGTAASFLRRKLAYSDDPYRFQPNEDPA